MNIKFLSIIVIILNLTAFSSVNIEENKINLNNARLEELVHIIKGIGIKRAESIILYRKKHGNFNRIQDIGNVPKIGHKFVDKNLKQLEAKLTIR